MKTWEKRTVYLMNEDDFLFNSCEFALITEIVSENTDNNNIIYKMFAETKDGNKYEGESYSLEEAKSIIEEFFDLYESCEFENNEVIYV